MNFRVQRTPSIDVALLSLAQITLVSAGLFISIWDLACYGSFLVLSSYIYIYASTNHVIIICYNYYLLSRELRKPNPTSFICKNFIVWYSCIYIYIEFGTTEYSVHGLQAHSSPPTLVSSAQVVRSNITVDRKPDLHSTTWTKLLYLFRVQDIYGSPNYYFFYFIHPHHS